MMTRLISTIAAVALSTLAFGQEATTDPQQILQAADEAIDDVKSFSYEGEAWAEGAMQNAIKPLKARVFCVKGDSPETSKIRIEIDDAGRKQLLITDGKELYMRDFGANVYAIVDQKRCNEADIYSLLFLAELAMKESFDAERNNAKSVYIETSRVDDQPVDEILSRYRTRDEARWFFDLKTHLPRKVVRQFRNAQGVTSSFHLVLHHLEVNPDISDDKFARPANLGRRPGLPVGWKAPDWTLKTPDGKSVSLSKMRGRTVLLDFWAVWCGPCKRAMPGIQKLHEEFAKQPLSVYGLSTWRRSGDPAAYMKANKFTYGLLMEGDDVADDYLVKGIPALYVIDSFGRVAFVGFGAGHDEAMRKAIESSLERGKPVTAPRQPRKAG